MSGKKKSFDSLKIISVSSSDLIFNARESKYSLAFASLNSSNNSIVSSKLDANLKKFEAS